jgi:two-component sensor histidine kinase
LHSLLWSAQRETHDPQARAVLVDAGQRVAAMAAAQQALYAARSVVTFDTTLFLQTVCDSAQQSFPNSVRILCDADSGELSNDTAMPLALILNELLINSVKHGTANDKEATIRVGLKNAGRDWQLFVEDQGPGFELPEVRRRSSGLGLVLGLVRQLGGTFEVHQSPCRCTIRFQTPS